MGLAYALVHLEFTIPLAAILSIIAYPLLTRLDLVRLIFIITVAVTATIPWDSYLIRTGVWSYPDDGVLGYSACSIPVEELFFFVVQTFITALLYIVCNKPVLQAQYLTTPAARPAWVQKWHGYGQAALGALTAFGFYLVSWQGPGTYLGLILAWACPFALFTWSISGDLILAMPWTSSILPTVAPTFYLWAVDELSLRNGVWTIESGTKLSKTLFGSLDIEEAVFFFASNTLVVFGLAAFDKAVAVCDAFPKEFPQPADKLPVWELLRARAMPSARYDMNRIEGIRNAVARLRKKSRSFYIASSVFPGRLRNDLTLLYSYCRLADDLVDQASGAEEALDWIAKLREYLDLRYGSGSPDLVDQYICNNFPSTAHAALRLLPSQVSSEPLYALLEGFKTDVIFSAFPVWPIKDEDDLELYASRVASTIGELCLDLVFHYSSHAGDRDLLYAAAREMGIALQFVNIARDVSVDAKLGRVYFPLTWLDEEHLTPEMVLNHPRGKSVERMRKRLLGKAFDKYRSSRAAMDLLPKEAKGPMTVAVESYMEIGRVLAEGGCRQEGKATVPAWRRAGVVWKTLRGN